MFREEIKYAEAEVAYERVIHKEKCNTMMMELVELITNPLTNDELYLDLNENNSKLTEDIFNYWK